MIDEVKLNLKLRSVFDVGTPPSRKCTDDSSWDAAKFIRSTFDGKTWLEVDCSNWDSEIFNEALYYFSEECLSYYFPAFIKWLVACDDDCDAVRDSFISNFETTGKAMVFNLGKPFRTVKFNNEQTNTIQYILLAVYESS